MRCPNCGTDTSPSSPTCAQCDAPLPPDGDATLRDHQDATLRDQQDATVRDQQDATVRDQQDATLREPQPPWTRQWDAQPDHTTPMPPSEERTTQLSPEPWSEPAIWQPPAPPKRSRLPYFLGAAGVVLLIGLAVAIVFWPSGSGSTPTASEPSTQQSRSAPSENASDEGDFDAQAQAVNKLLDEMGATRSDLGKVVVGGCTRDGLQRVLNARQGQLDEARNLEVSALDGGTPMKEALVRALEASTMSNQRYLELAPGCPSEGEVSDINRRASDAKTEFIGYWAPIAEKAGLPARTESDI